MPKKKTTKIKYNDDMIWKCYKYANAGHSDSKIASYLGVDKVTLFKYIKDIPVIKRAIDAGRKDAGPQGRITLESFVYKALPEEAQDYYDILQDEMDNWDTSETVIPVEVRQMMFFNLWYENDFNESEAIRKLRTSEKVIHEWRKENPYFAQIYNGMIKVRKDFVESKTMRLIAEGDSVVTHRVNAALNRDRGYGDKLEVTGTMNHNHAISMDITNLNLPREVLVQVLEAVREYEQKQADVLEVSDVEETVTL